MCPNAKSSDRITMMTATITATKTTIATIKSLMIRPSENNKIFANKHVINPN